MTGVQTCALPIYVDDVLDAFLLAEERADCPRGAVYNVGSGRQTTLRELVGVAREVFGLDAEPKWGAFPDRRWDTDRWIADSSRAAEELGWRATVSLGRGLAATRDWMASVSGAVERYRTGD